MDQQQATDFVIRELGKHHAKNDIIQKLCEGTSMNWRQAEKFIEHVQSEHQGAIATKQSPIVMFMGVGAVLLGFTLSIFIAYETLRGVVIFFLTLPIPYLGNITYFTIGVGLIAGGIRGMRDLIVQLWNS